MDWQAFLDNFQRHCSTNDDNTCVDFVRYGEVGAWEKVAGNPSWLRLTEQWTPTAKSLFFSMCRER
jgi:hypothetical protein